MSLFCDSCIDSQREVAELADHCAFWAYQAKWYYAQAHGIGNYDELPLRRQKEIDAVFEKARIAENRERLGEIPPSYDIGT